MSEANTPNPPRRSILIALLWHSFYSGNLGVSALAHANMRIIAQAAKDAGLDAKFVLFGPKGDTAFPQPDEFGDLEYVEASSFGSILAFRSILKKADLVFDIGSGDSFADIYGWKRFMKITGLKLLVPQARERLVLSPQTIGPFTNPTMRSIATRAMQRAHLIAARDQKSVDRASEMVGHPTNERIMLTTDVAFSLDCLENIPDNFPAIDNSKINIGLNVSGLLYRGGYAGGNQFGLTVDYAELIRRFLADMSARDDVQVWLISHVYRLSSPGIESDLGVARELAEQYPAARLSPVFTGAREAKTFISQMDIMFAARMHAAIGAVSTGTACLPMSYSIKFASLFGGLGYNRILDLKTATLDDALNAMSKALNDRERLSADAALARTKADEMLAPYRMQIDKLMAKLANT